MSRLGVAGLRGDHAGKLFFRLDETSGLKIRQAQKIRDAWVSWSRRSRPFEIRNSFFGPAELEVDERQVGQCVDTLGSGFERVLESPAGAFKISFLLQPHPFRESVLSRLRQRRLQSPQQSPREAKARNPTRDDIGELADTS